MFLSSGAPRPYCGGVVYFINKIPAKISIAEIDFLKRLSLSFKKMPARTKVITNDNLAIGPSCEALAPDWYADNPEIAEIEKKIAGMESFKSGFGFK